MSHCVVTSRMLSATWLLVVPLLACGADQATAPVFPTPPAAPKGSTVDVYHGVPVPDPYRWLEDPDSAEARRWIDAQNALSGPYLHSLPARAHFEETLQRLHDTSAPGELRWQGTAWVMRTLGPDGVELTIHDKPGAEPHTRISASELRLIDDQQVDGFRLGPNGRRLAFTVTVGGSEFLELRVLDLTTGELLPDRIPGLKFDMPFWTADGEHLVYWRYASADLGDRLAVDRDSFVAVHRLGTEVASDRVLARDTHDQVGVKLWCELSADGRFLLLLDQLGKTRRVSVIDLQDPMAPNWDAEPVALSVDRQPVDFIGSVGSTLFLTSRRDATRGRIVAVDTERPLDWRTVVPESEHLLQYTLLAGNRLVAHYRRDVISAVAVFGLDGIRHHDIDLPAPGSIYWVSGDPDHPDFTFSFYAYTRPPTLMHHDVHENTTRILAAQDLPGIDPTAYVSEQSSYHSKDGTRIPLFISRRTDRPNTRPRPTLLHGYGANSAVTAPEFRSDFFAWMEAGGVVAVANVRGGGEYGDEWAAAGRFANKQNTFDDFIAAAEHLIAEGWTTPEQLVIHGESNGGLLVGATMTQRPDLFVAALPVVGVLDALRFPSTTAGPRWATNHGDPTDPEAFAWLRSWSPLHRLEDGRCYPATLVTTAANDDLVAPSQSTKFAARLQAAQGCNRPTPLRVYESGGHGFFFNDTGAMADMLAFAAAHTGLQVAH